MAINGQKSGSRLVLELQEGAAEGLDSIGEKLGMRRRSEILRYALGLLETCAPYLQEGYDIVLQRKGDPAAIRVVVPRLCPPPNKNGNSPK